MALSRGALCKDKKHLGARVSKQGLSFVSSQLSGCGGDICPLPSRSTRGMVEVWGLKKLL